MLWREAEEAQAGEKAPAHGAVGRCPAVLRTLTPGFGGCGWCLVRLRRRSGLTPELSTDGFSITDKEAQGTIAQGLGFG
tara:strand:+ start:82 stop:318 length:237 start_codon:yes stop_codon:yes gene_type:complete